MRSITFNNNTYKLNRHTKHLLTMFVVLGLFTTSAVANNKSNASTLSLDNLERQRAALVSDMLNPAISVEQRSLIITKRMRALTDMERMVIRDTRLLQSNQAAVKRAFDNYESTFLVHAGAENKRNATEQWLTNINLSNKSVMNTVTGFRK